jgi:hypothetical protein
MDVALVVPGGACGALYTAAGVALMLELERAGVARVRAYHTTSAGSVLCAGALCVATTPAEVFERTLDFLAFAHGRRHTHWIEETVAAHMDAILPADAHVTCTGRLVIGVTRGARREAISAYETRDALVRAIAESCRLPLITAPARCVFERHDGYLAPSPDAAARAGATVVTLPYPPAWATVRMSLPVVWWAAWLFGETDAAEARAAMRAGVDRALARVARVVPVPADVVERVRAAAAGECAV